MQENEKPGTNPAGTPEDDHPLKDIPVRMNRLPWERDPEPDDGIDETDGTEESDETLPEEAHARPYEVGGRTYASPETAVDSAAAEKLFSMTEEEYEEDRSRLRVFFDVLLGKFWKLMSLNLLTGLFNLPALIFMFVFSIYYMQLLQPNLITEAADGNALMYLLVGYFPLALIFLSIPIVAFGPAQAGMHYILRSYAYEIPVFIWGDFKEKVRENLKQGLAVTFINLFVFILAMLDIYMYPRLVARTGAILLVANYLLIIAFLVFLMMSMYIYPMMVRYDLSLKNLYRNAFLLAIGRFLPNLLVLFLCAVLAYGPFLLAALLNASLGYFVVYIYHIALGLTLPGFISSFILNHAMDKVMLPKGEADQESGSNDGPET